MHGYVDDARSSKILLVMEYTEGGPVVLTSGPQQRRLSEAIARKFFRDALQVHVLSSSLSTSIKCCPASAFAPHIAPYAGMSIPCRSLALYCAAHPVHQGPESSFAS